MEALLKPQSEPRRNTFEGVDLREAGRRGGIASGQSRRLREQRELERKVLEARNGAAAIKLLELKRRDEAALQDERHHADAIVGELMDRADALEQTIADLRGEADVARDEYNRLEERRQAMALAVESDDALDELLRTVGEERATASAYRIGWGDESDEHVA